MRYLLIAVGVFIITLLAACFVVGNFNIMNWDMDVRGLVVTLWCGISIILCALSELDKP